MLGATSSEKEENQRQCQICLKNVAKYVCPRCGVPYCSLSCYKNEAKHLQCSESFYRDCVVESIKTEQVRDPASASKMQDVLNRFNQQYNSEDTNDNFEDELDSDDDEPLEKRLTGVDLNDSEEVWKHLSEEEKRDFQSFARNMEGPSDIIPEWVPWWTKNPEKKLVQDITGICETSASTSPLTKLHERQPDILDPIPKMKDLTRIQPNEHVYKGLINVIAAYVWTSKLFNGDLKDNEKILEVAGVMIFLSSFLSKDGVFKNLEHAVSDIPMKACQISVLSEGGTSIHNNLNRDIWTIVKGPDASKSLPCKAYLLAALTDCYTLFSKSSKVFKQTQIKSAQDSSCNSGEFSKLFPSPPPILSADGKLISKAKRKILYLLAFSNEYVQQGVSV